MKLHLKRKLLRFRLNFKKWLIKLDGKITLEQNKLNSFQIKAFQLWKLTLKDKTSILDYSAISRVRQIEKNDMLLIFYPGSQNWTLVIIDNNKGKKNLYEVQIPATQSTELCNFFDEENEKRMRLRENEKRDIIHEDLDYLIKKQQQHLEKTL